MQPLTINFYIEKNDWNQWKNRQVIDVECAFIFYSPDALSWLHWDLEIKKKNNKKSLFYPWDNDERLKDIKIKKNKKFQCM